MAREFKLPDIGEGLTEAEIVRWLVPEGERVEADQPVVEVETDKAVVEIPSPYAGVVLKHGGAEGQTIDVGSVLVIIGDDDEDSVSIETEPEPSAAPEAAPPIVGTLSEDAEVLETAPKAIEVTPSSVKALPLVRKLARELGIDLESVAPTGTDGRVTREDVESAMSPRPTSEVPPSPPVPPVEGAPTPQAAAGPQDDERLTMSRLRRTIAANMSKSWAEVPHVTTFDDIDATRLLEVRGALGDRHQIKIPIEALVLRAVLPALNAFPEFNATLDGDDVVVHGSHDIGIAVDTPDGLLVAVVKDVDSMSVLELAAEVSRLGQGARDRALGVAELTGQTFTVSNIGAVGGGHGTPIVPPGTTAILSIGRAKAKPIVYDGDLAIAPVMPLSLSYDHRVIDGGQGRRFMALLMENLEEPALFLAG